MSLATRAVEMLARIPPARTRDVTVRRDIEIAMPDGITLLADRYRAREDDGTEPIILMRSPYGRTAVWALGARALRRARLPGDPAELPRARAAPAASSTPIGTKPRTGSPRSPGSSGSPGSPGSSRMFGPSYLGIVQWAIASDPPPSLRAMAAPISSARVRSLHLPGRLVLAGEHAVVAGAAGAPAPRRAPRPSRAARGAQADEARIRGDTAP